MPSPLCLRSLRMIDILILKMLFLRSLRRSRNYLSNMTLLLMICRLHILSFIHQQLNPSNFPFSRIILEYFYRIRSTPLSLNNRSSTSMSVGTIDLLLSRLLTLFDIFFIRNDLLSALISAFVALYCSRIMGVLFFFEFPLNSRGKLSGWEIQAYF